MTLSQLVDGRWRLETGGAHIGYDGENLVYTLEIAADTGEGWTYYADIEYRTREKAVLPLVYDAGVLRAVIGAAYLKQGMAELQIRAVDGERVKKSNVDQIYIGGSINATAELTPPEQAVWDVYAAQAAQLRDEAQAAALRAEDAMTSLAPGIGENGNWFIGETDTGIPAATAEMTPPVEGTDFGAKCESFAKLFRSPGEVESFIFYTDPHLLNGTDYEDEFRTYIKTLHDYYSVTPTSFVVCGGDWIKDNDSYDGACFKLGYIDGWMRTNFDRHYFVNGNHETNYTGAETLSKNTIRNLMYRGQEQLYYAFDGVSTRCYVLDSWTPDYSMTAYHWEQIDWLAAQLVKDDAAHSAIFMHIGFYLNSASTPQVSEFPTIVCQLCQAYNTQSTVTLNGKTYDFAGCSGRMHFVLSGHDHVDHVERFCGIPVISTEDMKEGGVPTFDLCFADYNAEKLHLVRVGTGEDRTVDIRSILPRPLIDIDMEDGTNVGTGGSAYNATLGRGGQFLNGKFVVDGTGCLTVPTPFMCVDATTPWTVMFVVDNYQISTATRYSSFCRGNGEVPSMYYDATTSMVENHYSTAYKITKNSGPRATFLDWWNDSYVSDASNQSSLLQFNVPKDLPTSFVFRNDGINVSLWVNGVEYVRDSATDYIAASTLFALGTEKTTNPYDMTHMECSVLKLWDVALTDDEIRTIANSEATT